MERGWKRRLRFSYAPSIDLCQPRGEGVPAPGSSSTPIAAAHSVAAGPAARSACRAGLILSTSRSGHCLDNAVAESFFHRLKTELVYQHRYRTREEARLAIFDYIAAFYNRTRRHSSNAYRSPDDQETQYAASGT